ncbi:MAG: hypothetical protein IKG83_01140 [Prevotella sp.]|nr:hypothetical protein [Prevotella sp.]
MEEKILELIGVVDELNGCIENILNTILPPDCDLIGRDETGHEYHIRSYSIDRAWKLLRDNYINFSAHFNDISNVTDVALLYGNIKKYLKLGVEPWNDDSQVYLSCEKWWKVFEYNNFQTLELSMEQQAKDRKATDIQGINPEPQRENPKPTRGRGRPKETFKDKMIDDTDGRKLQRVHVKTNGKKGKDFSLIILACIKKGWLVRPTYTQAKNEFGDIGTKTGYNKYLNDYMFTEEELEGAINSLDYQ